MSLGNIIKKKHKKVELVNITPIKDESLDISESNINDSIEIKSARSIENTSRGSLEGDISIDGPKSDFAPSEIEENHDEEIA